MPLFRYIAIASNGKKQTGIVDADSYESAREKLLRQKILVTKLQKHIGKKRESHLSKSELLHFTRDLSQFLRSGLPLYESLLAIEEKYRFHKNHGLFLDLCDQVKQGRSLSGALKKFPAAFDPIYLSMVSAAEESGTLPAAFQELTQLISKSEKLKKQLISALIYPAFLGTFCLIILSGLFFFLIPSMKELLSDRNLHPLTEAILNISSFLEAHAKILAFGFISGILALYIYGRSKQGKLALQKVLLKIPFFKSFIPQTVMIRFCQTLSVLLFSGVPVVEALKRAKKVMNHKLFEDAVSVAEKGLMEGKRLSEELAKSPLIPKMVIRMLQVSDEAGETPEMLRNISQIYEENMEKTLSRLTTLIQPILLLILGIIVGIVLLAVLLPLTDVSSFLN
ncbi:MAG: type II secretion system F family protein [Simkaniaceae bacterium]